MNIAVIVGPRPKPIRLRTNKKTAEPNARTLGGKISWVEAEAGAMVAPIKKLTGIVKIMASSSVGIHVNKIVDTIKPKTEYMAVLGLASL